MRLSSSRIVIAFHQGVPVGPSFDLRRFLLSKNVPHVLFVAHPLTYLPEFYKDTSQYIEYLRNREIKKHKAIHWVLPDVLLYLKDMIYTFIWVIQWQKKVDIFFGVDPLNALSGILLKKLGFTKYVVYYSIDFFTNRFQNKLLNTLYHSVDRFCITYADETWNLSDEMKVARKKTGLKSVYEKKQYLVPIGVWLTANNILPVSKINMSKLVFIGTFVKMMGIDLIIDALPIVLKQNPNIHLHLIGDGPEMKNLQKKIASMKLKKFITIHGWVSDQEKLQDLLQDAAVGLAPFNTSVITDEIKNADPAKLKDYMKWGMPVIVTRAISNYTEIAEKKFGIVIDYDSHQLANAILKLVGSKNLLSRYRNNAADYIRKFDYEDIYSKNIMRIMKKIS